MSYRDCDKVQKSNLLGKWLTRIRSHGFPVVLKNLCCGIFRIFWIDLGLQGKTIVQCVSNSISPEFGQIIYWLSVQRQNDSRVHLYRSILTMESTHAASIKSFNCFLWLIYAAVFLIYCQKCKDATTWKSRLI